MKETFYLYSSPNNYMGGSDSYDVIAESDLFREVNKWMIDSPYITFYSQVSKNSLLKKSKSIKKTKLQLKEEELEAVQWELGRHNRVYRFGGPNREADDKRDKLKEKIDKLKKRLSY